MAEGERAEEAEEAAEAAVEEGGADETRNHSQLVFYECENLCAWVATGGDARRWAVFESAGRTGGPRFCQTAGGSGGIGARSVGRKPSRIARSFRTEP